MPRASKDPPDWKAQVDGEIVGLIESASKHAPGVKRHRDHGVGPGKDAGASADHEPRDRCSERTTAAVLEGVNDVAQRAVVASGASRHDESWRMFAAAGADEDIRSLEQPGVVRRPRAQRIAANDAQRRGDVADCAPARLADRAGERPLKDVVAARACRRQKRSHEIVHRRRPDHHADGVVQARCQGTIDAVSK